MTGDFYSTYLHLSRPTSTYVVPAAILPCGHVVKIYPINYHEFQVVRPPLSRDDLRQLSPWLGLLLPRSSQVLGRAGLRRALTWFNFREKDYKFPTIRLNSVRSNVIRGIL